MVKILIGVAGSESAVAIIGAAAFFLLVFLKKSEIIASGAEFYCRQLRLCRRWSLLLTAVAWAAALCGTWEQCVADCQALGEHCRDMAETWLVAGLVFMLVSLLLTASKRTEVQRKQMRELTSAALSSGIVFTVLAAVLAGA